MKKISIAIALALILSCFSNASNLFGANFKNSKITNRCFSMDTLSPSLRELFLKDFLETSYNVLGDSLKVNINYKPSLSRLQIIANQMEYSDVNLFSSNVVEAANFYKSLENQGSIPLPTLPCTKQLKIAVTACALLIVKDAVFGGIVDAVLEGGVCLAVADLVF